MPNNIIKSNTGYIKTHLRQEEISKKGKDKRSARDLSLTFLPSIIAIFNVILYEIIMHGSCTLTQTTIGYRINGRTYCRYTVNKAVLYLEALGFITIQRKWWFANKITLNLTLEELKFMAPQYSSIRLWLAKLTLFTKDKDSYLINNHDIYSNHFNEVPKNQIISDHDPCTPCYLPEMLKNKHPLTIVSGSITIGNLRANDRQRCSGLFNKTKEPRGNAPSLIVNSLSDGYLLQLYQYAPWLEKMGFAH
jgi:hypothetical protein